MTQRMSIAQLNELQASTGRKKRGNKYHAKKTRLDGQTFDSGKEAKRYAELKILERRGDITDLRTQVKFELIPKQAKPSGGFERAVSFTADFQYRSEGMLVVEDAKSEATRKARDFPIRRKLLLLVHGIELREV